MKQTLTAKLELLPQPQEAQALRDLGLAYREAANFASQKAFELDKTTRANLLHQHIYGELRTRFHLPSQIACSVNRYVTAAYKTLWSRAKANAKHRRKGWTQCLYRGLDKPPKFRERTVPYQYHYDFAFKKGQQVSIMTLQGRIVVPYQGWDRHIQLIQSKQTHIGGAKLWHDCTRKSFYLLVSLTIEFPDPQPTDPKRVVGVDLGQRYLATATDTGNNTLFVPGKQAKHKARQFQKKRQQLQTKRTTKKRQRLGTRSVNRRLIAVARRERRHKQSLNHSTAKQIVQRFPQALIGLEDLKDVRERTNRKHSKDASSKQRQANREQGSGAFAELQSYLA